MTHWTGTRSGFNTRGYITNAEAIKEARARAEYNNPDSLTWNRSAEAKLDELELALGPDDYRLFMEIQFPTMQGVTWKQIDTVAGFFLDNRSALFQELECRCNGIEQPCQVCRANATIRYNAEHAEVEA